MSKPTYEQLKRELHHAADILEGCRSTLERAAKGETVPSQLEGQAQYAFYMRDRIDALLNRGKHFSEKRWQEERSEG